MKKKICKEKEKREIIIFLLVSCERIDDMKSEIYFKGITSVTSQSLLPKVIKSKKSVDAIKQGTFSFYYMSLLLL